MDMMAPKSSAPPSMALTYCGSDGMMSDTASRSRKDTTNSTRSSRRPAGGGAGVASGGMSSGMMRWHLLLLPMLTTWGGTHQELFVDCTDNHYRDYYFGKRQDY